MKLRLFHGRRHPDEELSDWGFEGPTIEGVAFVRATYWATFVVGFHTLEAMELAARQTGWKSFDARMLEITIVEDLIEAVGSYYGDFELADDDALH